VLSRRAVIEANAGEERAEAARNAEGAIVKASSRTSPTTARSWTSGGIDGLHITDLAWRRVRHPSEVLSVGQEITAKILKFDQEKNRVSLGLKQLGEDPWVGISRRYPRAPACSARSPTSPTTAHSSKSSGHRRPGHVSEMDWTNKNVAPSKVVQLGDEVEVMVLEIDEDRRRISLGMKQCKPIRGTISPQPQEGRQVGQIKSITDFGVFIGLPGGIDGLVHLSDLSCEAGEEAVRKYKKGDEVEASCSASTSRRSASRSASSSSKAIRSATLPPTTRVRS
jgi:small subunit ribosomal protein S1